MDCNKKRGLSRKPTYFQHTSVSMSRFLFTMLFLRRHCNFDNDPPPDYEGVTDDLPPADAARQSLTQVNQLVIP